MKIIDLFSGCGGLSHGFIKNDYKVVKAIEFDKNIAQTYINNHPDVQMIVDDIRNVDDNAIFMEGDADIIIGGPPCQGFSMAGARIRDGFVEDPRNYLFKHYFNIVKTVKPKAFIMENVKGIMTMENGKIFEEILDIFSKESFNIYYRVVKGTDFGVPQKRERMIIIGVRDGYNVDFDKVWESTKDEIKTEDPHFFETVTVFDAIGNLAKTTEDGEIENPKCETYYQKYLKSENPIITNHTKTKHSKVAIDRMSKINNGENFTSLDEDIKSVHSGSYGRLCWEDQSPTITTRFDTPAGGRFIHPVENRTLSPREAARIQSFPDDFIFYGSKTSICKQIGNAVPPKISYFLARYLKNIIEK